MEELISESEARQIYRENKGKVVEEDVGGFVVLRGINKIYDNHVQAVYDFDLSIGKKEFIVLVGPSGCGKSTTLRMIAGLEDITSGYLYIDGVLANHLESKDRDIAMVFQSYALYPNMTVYDNIGFGLSVRRMPKEQIREKVFEAAEILDLGAYLDRKPRELSGGQMQRVALGRAIVRNAKLFLMDEPLSNLDAKLRVQMRSEIVKLHKRIAATTVYVTHDQTEAMTMADRIVVMNKGFIQQIGTPAEIYSEPANVFVATFIGSPPMNVFRARLSEGQLADGEVKITLPAGTEEKYRAFIEEKIAYFDALKKRCDEAMEKAVGEASEAFGASSKRTAALTEACQSGAWRTAIRLIKKYAVPLMEEERAVAAALKKAGSGEAFVKKETLPTEKRKKKGEEKSDLHTENLAKLGELSEAYREIAAAPEIFAGIRPEHIHLCGEFSGNASEPIEVVADFVELLGSELCVYFELFGSRLICKLAADRLIRMGEKIKVCLDMDKLKLFDCVGGMRAD